jgi:hypothetical protein
VKGPRSDSTIFAFCGSIIIFKRNNYILYKYRMLFSYIFVHSSEFPVTSPFTNNSNSKYISSKLQQSGGPNRIRRERGLWGETSMKYRVKGSRSREGEPSKCQVLPTPMKGG